MEMNTFIFQFLRRPVKKILLIVGDIDENSFRDLKLDVENEKIPVHYIDLREATELENFYIKLGLDKISEKIIIFCNPFLLHPTLDPSIYFAPIKGGRVQRYLLSKLILPVSKAKESTKKQVSAIVEQASPLKPAVLWHQKLMTQDAVMMQMLADNVTKDEKFRNYLFQVVYSSRDHHQMQVAAANAITALNYAKVSFSGMDLSRIRVARANLSYAVLDSADLQKADLSYVRLKGAWLNNAKLMNSIMKSVNLGLPGTIPIEQDVQCCRYSPDGRLIVVASDIWIILYDAATLKKIRVLEGHTDQINSIDLNLKDNLLISGSGNLWGGTDNTVRLWDMKNGEELKCFDKHTSPVLCVAPHPNNKVIASGSEDHCILLWEISSENVRSFRGHTGSVTSVVFNKNGQLLISGGDDKNIRVWNVLSGEQIKYFEGAEIRVTEIAISANDQWVAWGCEGSSDYGVHVWEMNRDQSHLKILQGHSWCVTSVAFSQNNQFLISGSKDRTVRIWDLATGELYAKPLEGHCFPVTSVHFHPNGRYVLSGSGTTTREESDKIDVRVWDLSNETLELDPRKAQTALSHITSLSCSPDGHFVIFGISVGGDRNLTNNVRILFANRGESAVQFVGYPGTIKCVVSSPNGKFIATCGENLVSINNSIRIFDYKNTKTFRLLNTNIFSGKVMHAGRVNDLAFSPDSKFLVSGGEDNIVLLWHVDSGKLCAVLLNSRISTSFQDKKSVGITKISYSPNGELIAIGHTDGSIRIWEVYNPKEEKYLSGICDKEQNQFVGHQQSITALSFSMNGELLVSASYDNTIRLWDVKEGKIISTLMEYRIWERSGGIKVGILYKISVSFAPDSEHIVAGFCDGLLLIQSISTREIKFSVKLTTAISALSWSGCFLYAGQNITANLSCWRYEKNQLILQWATHNETLAVENCNIADGQLDQLEHEKLIGLGAVKSRQEMESKFKQRIFFSMTPKEIAFKLRKDSADPNVAPDDFYCGLVENAIRMEVHLEQSGNGNTALHWALFNGDTAKIIILLRAIEKYDGKMTQALEIGNQEGETPLRLLFKKVNRSIEIPQLVLKILKKKQRHINSLSNERAYFQKSLAPTHSEKSTKVTTEFQKGNAALLRNDLSSAIYAFKESIKTNSSMAIFHEKLAYCYWLSAHASKDRSFLINAGEEFDAALNIEVNARIYALYGLYLYRNKRFADALLYFSRIITSQFLKESNEKMRFFDNNKELLPLDLRVEVSPGRSIEFGATPFDYYFFIMSKILLNQTTLIDDYLKEFSEYISLELNAVSYSLMGYCYKQLGQYTQARLYFMRAIELDPDYEVAKRNIKLCESLAQQSDNAPLVEERSTSSSTRENINDDETVKLEHAKEMSLGH